LYTFTDKILARLNKDTQKLMISVNKNSSKRQNTANRKIINIPCTTFPSSMVDIVKDEDLMPPPSCSIKPEYDIQYENSNTTRKFFI